MGLLVNATADKKITIQGTEIEIPNVYVRLEFAGRADGKTLEVNVSTYASKDAFKNNASLLSTNVPIGSFSTEILQEEYQGIETAHKYAKLALEQQGFDVVIDL